MVCVSSCRATSGPFSASGCRRWFDTGSCSSLWQTEEKKQNEMGTLTSELKAARSQSAPRDQNNPTSASCRKPGIIQNPKVRLVYPVITSLANDLLVTTSHHCDLWALCFYSQEVSQQVSPHVWSGRFLHRTIKLLSDLCFLLLEKCANLYTTRV